MRVSCLLLPILLCFAAACQPKKTQSDIKHTMGEPVRSTLDNAPDTAGSLDWMPSTDPLADYSRFVKPRLGTDGKPAIFAAKDHPTVQRLQFWMDVVDKHLRGKFPQATKGIPSPVANVWVSKGPNGMAMPMSGCADVQVALKESATQFSDILLGVNFNGALFQIKDARCIEIGATTPERVAEWFNRNNASCTFSSKNERVVVGSDCKIPPPLINAGIVGTKRFQIIGTSPVITITSGMFSLVHKEDHFVAVVAHELGHYYRSHPALKTAVYNFFYELGENNPTVKPSRTKNPELLNLGEKAIKVSRGDMNSPEAKQVLREALDKRLGYYTFEQEADDIALEWLGEIGIDPQAMIDKLFALMQYKRALPAGEVDTDYEFGYDRCKRLYDANWREGKEPAYVPIGDFTNPHHSLCYRIFNASRELAVHNHRPTGTRLVPPGGTWSEIQISASALEKDGVAEPVAPGVLAEAGAVE